MHIHNMAEKEPGVNFGGDFKLSSLTEPLLRDIETNFNRNFAVEQDPLFFREDQAMPD